MSEHVVSVAGGDGPTWDARCTCGWHGHPRGRPDSAVRDQERHVRGITRQADRRVTAGKAHWPKVAR